MRGREVVRAARMAMAIALAAGTLASPPARAQDRRTEAAARDAMKRAVADDASGDFDTAFIRLRKAIKACGTIRCRPVVRAQLQRDLGVMQVKRGDRTGAAQSFAESLRLDPGGALAEPYARVADVRSAWAAAHDEASGVKHPPPPPAPTAPVAEPDEPVESRAEAPLEDSSRELARWWVGVAGSFDIVSLPGATNVCKLDGSGVPANSAGYYCTLPDGTDYPTRASRGQNDSLSQGGTVPGGPAIGAVRVMLSVDYAPTASVLVGARLGALVNGYPGAAAASDGHGFTSPIYGELRGAYLFGNEPLTHSGFAPMLFAGGGFGESAVKTTVRVVQGNAPIPVAGNLARVAWRVGGPLFVDLGGGVRYAFSQRIAFLADLKVSATFGGSGGLAASPEIAVQYGF